MIEKIKDVREVTEIKETVIGEIMKCDICGKVIYDTQKEEPTDMRKGQHWWHLVTGHNDWGNDSRESVESFYICSRKCIRKKFEEYLEVSDHMLGSKYFELEQETR